MAARNVVINLLGDIQLIVGRIDARRRTSGVDETDGEIGAGCLGAGREVHAIEITEGIDDAIVGLAVDHGDDLGPTGDAIHEHPAVVAACGHPSREVGHAGIESGSRDGLVAALAGARHHDMLAIPFRLGGQDVDPADESQHHASEVSLLAIVTEFVAIRILGTGIKVRVELLGLSVG